MSVWEQELARYRALNKMLRALFPGVGELMEFLRYRMDRRVAAAAEFIPPKTSLARACAVAAQELVRHGFYRPTDFATFLQGFPAEEDTIRAAAEACGVRWDAVAGSRRGATRSASAPAAAPHVIVCVPLERDLVAVRALMDAWEPREGRDGLPYALAIRARDQRPPLRIAAVSGELGQVRALQEELAPRCIAACGTCAGVRGRVFLGDVIVAEAVVDVERGAELFRLARPWKRRAQGLARSAGWQAGLAERRPPSLRWLRDRLLQLLQEHDDPVDPREHPELLQDQAAWRQVLRMVQPWTATRGGRIALNEAGREWVADYFLRSAYQIPSDPPLAAHVGPVAVGAAGSALGVEAGLSGVAEVIAASGVPALLVEAVARFADEPGDGDGDDRRFHAFASEASARFLVAFLAANL